MATTQVLKTTPLLIGRWTPKFLLSPGRKTLSSWRVAPPSGKRFAAHADQNAAQSRIHRASRETHNGIESYCCRVFSNAARKEHQRSATREVPLGKKVQHAGEC
jgi:hypothetical protein